MELAWIEDFLALTRTQNFTEAAAQRCTTQPAFGRRIQNLEEWLGVPLFDRTTRPIRLTSSGDEFLRRAERIREEILDARRIARSSQSHYRQATRIYTTTAIAVGIMPEWLRTQGVPNPSVLTSSTGGSLEALRQGRADQIFLPWFIGDGRETQLSYRKIAEDRLIPVESEKATKRAAFKNKIFTAPVLMYAPGTIFGQQVARHMADLKIVYDKDIVCESSSAETLLAFARQRLGVAWVPRSLVGRDVVRCKVPEILDVPCDIMLVTRLP